jgi:hypothetical protein
MKHGRGNLAPVAAEGVVTVLVAVIAVVVDGQAVEAGVAADLRGANRAGRNTTLG